MEIVLGVAIAAFTIYALTRVALAYFFPKETK